MAHAIVINGEPTLLVPGLGFEDAEGNSYAANTVDLWDAGALAGIGVYEIAEAEPIPNGKRAVGQPTLGMVGAVPRWVQASENIPLADLKAARTREAEAVYLTKLAVGYPVTLDGISETLQLRNSEDRTNWLGVLIAAQAGVAAGGGALAYPTKIRTTSNTGYVVSNTEAVTLMFGLLAWAGEMFGARTAIKDEINAAINGTAVAAVDIEAGYP